MLNWFIISSKLAGEELRGLLSILILTFGFKFGYDLFFSKILPSMNITNSLANQNLIILQISLVNASHIITL